MKQVKQIIPEGQKDILIEALNLMELALNTINSNDENLHSKLFDILTLKALLNNTELVVNLSFDHYNRFTAINGVDFPNFL